MSLPDPPEPRLIPVLVQAGDGPIVVWHTREEFASFREGVDLVAAVQLGKPS